MFWWWYFCLSFTFFSELLDFYFHPLFFILRGLYYFCMSSSSLLFYLCGSLYISYSHLSAFLGFPEVLGVFHKCWSLFSYLFCSPSSFCFIVIVNLLFTFLMNSVYSPYLFLISVFYYFSIFLSVYCHFAQPILWSVPVVNWLFTETNVMMSFCVVIITLIFFFFSSLFCSFILGKFVYQVFFIPVNPNNTSHLSYLWFVLNCLISVLDHLDFIHFEYFIYSEIFIFYSPLFCLL